MQEQDFAIIVALICKEDARYDKKSYDFVRLGLDQTVKEIRKKDPSRTEKGGRHVSGQELLEGLKTYALDQFGPLTKTVLNAWGLKKSRDFGDIVFNLIEYNVFSKTESDRPEDFDGGFTFDEAFVKPFLPKKKLRIPGATGALGTA